MAVAEAYEHQFCTVTKIICKYGNDCNCDIPEGPQEVECGNKECQLARDDLMTELNGSSFLNRD